VPTAPTATRPTKDYKALTRKGSSKRKPRLCIIGQEGVGKTTAGAETPKPIFLCSEDGLIGPQFESLDLNSYAPESWEDLFDYIDFLITGDHDRETLVLDTVDWFEQMCHRYVIARDRVNEKGNPLLTIDDYGWGKGDVVSATEFQRLLQRLEQLSAKRNMMIVFLCHSAVKNFKNPEGEDYERFEGKLGRRVMALVKEWCDAVLHAHYETHTLKDKATKRVKGVGGKTRIMECNHSAAWDAKNRYGLPDGLPFDMATLLNAIENGNGAGGSSEDLVAAIRELMQQIPVEKHAAIEAAIAGTNGDAAALSHALNRVRTTIANLENTTNG
jgi:hypothetical protein